MKFLDVPMSGSRGGVVATRGRAGQVLRTRSQPVQTTTTGAVTQARQILAIVSQLWSSLTPAQQAAWDNLASLHPRTDSLGSSLTLTGHQLFTAKNTAQLRSFGTTNVNPPTQTAVAGIGITGFTASATTGISISFTHTSPSGYLLLYLTQPVSAGRTSWPNFRYIKFSTLTVATTLSAALYVAQFGTMTIGQRIFARLDVYNSSQWPGAKSTTTTLITA